MNLPDKVSWEKSFSMYVVGALKYSVNSAVVGGGESRVGLYGLGKHVESGLKLDAGVPNSGYLHTQSTHNYGNIRYNRHLLTKVYQTGDS